MKIYVEKMNRTLELGLYGINGEESTEEYLLENYSEYTKTFHRLTEEEKARYNTAADYAVSNGMRFNRLVAALNQAQEAIDRIARLIIENGWSYEEAAAFCNINDRGYLI